MIGLPATRYQATVTYQASLGSPLTSISKPQRAHYITDLWLVGAGGQNDGITAAGGGEVKHFSGATLNASAASYTVTAGTSNNAQFTGDPTAITVAGVTYQAKGGSRGGYDYAGNYSNGRGGDGGVGGAGGVVAAAGDRGVGGTGGGATGANGGNGTPSTSGNWTVYPGGGGGQTGGSLGGNGGAGYTAGTAGGNGGGPGGGGGGGSDISGNSGLAGHGVIYQGADDFGLLRITWRS